MPGKQTRRRTSVYTKTREALLISEAQALEDRAEQAAAIVRGMEAVVEYTDAVKSVFDTYSFLKKFAGGKIAPGLTVKLSKAQAAKLVKALFELPTLHGTLGNLLEQQAKKIKDPAARAVWLHLVFGAKAHLLKELEEGKFPLDQLYEQFVIFAKGYIQASELKMERVAAYAKRQVAVLKKDPPNQAIGSVALAPTPSSGGGDQVSSRRSVSSVIASAAGSARSMMPTRKRPTR